MRSYVNFTDFMEAIKKYKPACLKQQLEDAALNRANANSFELECEEHFRNICESGAQELDEDDMNQETFETDFGRNITVGLSGDGRPSESSDMNVDEETTPIQMNASLGM